MFKKVFPSGGWCVYVNSFYVKKNVVFMKLLPALGFRKGRGLKIKKME
jgi:hypothetical protein